VTLVEILQGANVALHVIAARVVLVITLVMTFALFCWSMYLQSQNSIIIAAAWAVGVFLPVLLTSRGVRHGIEAKHDAASEASGVPTRAAARVA
jgi:hypothetical protein